MYDHQNPETPHCWHQACCAVEKPAIHLQRSCQRLTHRSQLFRHQVQTYRRSGWSHQVLRVELLRLPRGKKTPEASPALCLLHSQAALQGLFVVVREADPVRYLVEQHQRSGHDCHHYFLRLFGGSKGQHCRDLKAHPRQAGVGQVDDSLGSGRGPGYRRFVPKGTNS